MESISFADLTGRGEKVILSIRHGENADLSEMLENAFSARSMRVLACDECEHVLAVDLAKSEYGELIEICSCLIEDAASGLVGPFHIGVGGVFSDPAQATDSYRQSQLALRAAMTPGSQSGLTEYKNCLLDSVAVSLPPETVAYIDALRGMKGMEEFLQPDFARIFAVFLEKNLNISDTSREAYIHRNSLKYKLDKLYRISGLDLRRLNDAVVFKFILAEHRP